MITAPDRLQELVMQSNVAGIDFVYVHDNQLDLDVYFFEHLDGNTNPLVGNLTDDQIRIFSPEGNEGLRNIQASINGWSVIDSRDVLHLQTIAPGDFTLYTLFINDNQVDPYFNNITFSFKANCESDLDCIPKPQECPPDELVDFPVDYLARDFWSFRRALLDFATQRYPEWNDRLEADGGIMLAELMSALGDEMAYFQDRVAREAYMETATQRRSIRRHARLVDYTVHDGLAAAAWIDFQLNVGAGIQSIPAGMRISSISDKGQEIHFEIGRGLDNVVSGVNFSVDEARNILLPHIWDEDDVCLPIGATEMHVQGHVANLFDSNLLPPGVQQIAWVLLKTIPMDLSIPSRNHMVRLIDVVNEMDPVFNGPITRFVWEDGQALPFEMNRSFMEVHANMIPATAGNYIEQFFIVGDEPSSLPIPTAEQERLERAVERQGHDHSLTYLFSLLGSDSSQLVWLGKEPTKALPEVRLTEIEYNNISSQWDEVLEWDWKRSFLGTNSSQSQDNDYTLDDGIWRRVKGFQRIGQEIIHKDYASDAGKTIRFGDGDFGMIPAEQSVFKIQYRLGGGKNSNVAADTLTHFDRTTFGFIDSVSNPLPAIEGMDPESSTQIRQLSSEAFRAITYRAVRPEDYAEAAERLPWVQRAGTAFRWTGSWLSAFVTPDPRNTVVLSDANRLNLVQQLDRFRQAGKEAHVLNPVYASIHLEITICVAPDAYQGEVKEMVLEALFGKGGARPEKGYFSPDNFTFGTPLDRSTLEAGIQQVSGVRAVEDMTIERRGWFKQKRFKKLRYDPGQHTIIRIENDPLHPERGTVKLIMKGGA